MLQNKQQARSQIRDKLILEELPKGSCIGILGGGQLGRMLVDSAKKLGYECVVWDESRQATAFKKCGRDNRICNSYDSESAFDEFVERADVMTLEFENIPYELVERIALKIPTAPTARILEIVQDRFLEKQFFDRHKIPCAKWHAINEEPDVKLAGDKLGYPLILKTTRGGYDGKGQGRADNENELMTLWQDLKQVNCIAEQVIPFDKEISIIGARCWNGKIAIYDIAENQHENHILRISKTPADISPKIEEQANNYLVKLLNDLEVVGLLALEMFVEGENVLANEMAARPHNSGHWTMDGSQTSQFEQCIRAVTAMNLGSTTRKYNVEMWNLLGDEIDNLPPETNSVKVHDYDKGEARGNRKMGHVNNLIAL